MAERATAEWAVLIPGLVVLAGVALCLSAIDWRDHRLPNKIVGPLAAGVGVWIVVLGVVADAGDRMITALLTGAIAFGVFFVRALTGGMGGGDAKFAFPLAAALGWVGNDAMQAGVIALAVSAGVFGLFTIATGKGTNHRIAYGPFMTIGLLCGAAWGLF